MLAQRQRQFIAEITASDDGPESTSLGMGIYRNAYRARLADALATSFERVQRWVGENMFNAAAAHYILSHPPQSWTLDAYGAAFPDLLAELFADDPEVAELAWLEWHMQQAFAARDRPQLTPMQLTSAGYGPQDWERLRLYPAAGFAARRIGHNVPELWHVVAGSQPDMVATCLAEPGQLVVWRRDLAPRFRVLVPDEFAALDSLAQGALFGEVAAQLGETRLADLGGWFAQWLGEGLLSEAIRA